MSTPREPVSKDKSHRKSTRRSPGPMVSPYFSPARKCVLRPDESSSPRGNNFHDAGSDASSLTNDGRINHGDTKHDKDPLVRFYRRSFTRLYARLALAKPLLIQERVADDPWKVLIAVILLNKTSGKLAIPVFWEIMSHYPDALSLSQAPPTFLQSLLHPLGLHVTRSNRLIDLSCAYIDDPPCFSRLRKSRSYHLLPCPPISSDRVPSEEPLMPKIKRLRYLPTPISHLPGMGPYALDSYRIFCTPHEWKEVLPSDKELIRYLKWRWAYEERKMWSPNVGVIGNVELAYLEELLQELESGG